MRHPRDSLIITEWNPQIPMNLQDINTIATFFSFCTSCFALDDFSTDTFSHTCTVDHRPTMLCLGLQYTVKQEIFACTLI